MRGERNTDRNTRKFISIPDMDKWEQIDEIMQNPKYEKSFNKVINEALDYGLPLLLKEIKGEVSYESTEDKYDKKQLDLYYRLDDIIMAMVDLTQEMVLNETISKSLICSLFNLKVHELGTTSTKGQMLSSGELRDTPEYLQGFEKRELRKLMQKRQAKNKEAIPNA